VGVDPDRRWPAQNKFVTILNAVGRQNKAKGCPWPYSAAPGRRTSGLSAVVDRHECAPPDRRNSKVYPTFVRTAHSIAAVVERWDNAAASNGRSIAAYY
jgi:hypothetical protein